MPVSKLISGQGTLKQYPALPEYIICAWHSPKNGCYLVTYLFPSQLLRYILLFTLSQNQANVPEGHSASEQWSQDPNSSSLAPAITLKQEAPVHNRTQVERCSGTWTLESQPNISTSQRMDAALLALRGRTTLEKAQNQADGLFESHPQPSAGGTMWHCYLSF